jgi:hypothetical protein
MVDALTIQEPEYSLTESAILSSRLLSTATSPDALARPDALHSSREISPARKIVFRKHWPEGDLIVEVRGSVSHSLRASVEDVLDLLDLPPRWNSYSAKPIAVPIVIRVIQLLADLLNSEVPSPLIVPRVRGGIQLEWHTAGVDIEVYVDSPETITFFAGRHGEEEVVEQALAGHEEELKTWLHQISRK